MHNQALYSLFASHVGERALYALLLPHNEFVNLRQRIDSAARNANHVRGVVAVKVGLVRIEADYARLTRQAFGKLKS